MQSMHGPSWKAEIMTLSIFRSRITVNQGPLSFLNSMVCQHQGWKGRCSMYMCRLKEWLGISQCLLTITGDVGYVCTALGGGTVASGAFQCQCWCTLTAEMTFKRHWLSLRKPFKICFCMGLLLLWPFSTLNIYEVTVNETTEHYNIFCRLSPHFLNYTEFTPSKV